MKEGTCRGKLGDESRPKKGKGHVKNHLLCTFTWFMAVGCSARSNGMVIERREIGT